MPIISELRISITAEDYNRLFKDNADYVKEKTLHYGYNFNSFNDKLPARFLEIVRSKKSKYSSSKDMELWEDYCIWCDIVLNRSSLPVTVKGNY